jgi:hypothetical protein
MINDVTKEDIILIFCLTFDKFLVTGTVSDELGKPVSTDKSVTGISIHDSRPGKDFTTLNFRWDKGAKAIKISMVGFVFVDDDDEVRRFQGKFIALAAGSSLAEEGGESARAMLSPDPGETGTGNGNQT